MNRTITAILGVAMFTAAAANAAEPAWIRAWQEYAAQTGDPRHAEWVELISSPEARGLEQAWTEFRGYNASSLLAEANIPDDLKPGLVITKENMGSYPWLSEYLPEEWVAQLSSDWFPIGEIRIVPTTHYYMSKGKLEATKEYAAAGGSFSVNEKGELIAGDGSLGALTQAALPFLPEPQNGLELEWLYVTHSVGTDNLFFHPITFDVCNSRNKLERSYEAHLWWKRYHGRRDFEPLGHVAGKEEIIEGGSIYFLKPFDVRGLAGVRQRFAASDKDDDFTVFLPSLRRTRVLSGSDAQDPLAAGLEVTWDEWRAYWQKTDPENFDYELAGTTAMLAQPENGALGFNYEKTEDGCGIKWIEMELRPVWILKQTDKGGKYQYATRINYIDREFYYMQHERMYDVRNNLWRTWQDQRNWNPKTGIAQWKSVWLPNHVSKRMTLIEMTTDWETAQDVPVTRFDIDQLRDYR